MSFESRVLLVPKGGTGGSTFTDGGVIIGNGTGNLQVTSAGTSGQVLTSNGAGVDPTFQIPIGLVVNPTVVVNFGDLSAAALTTTINLYLPTRGAYYSINNASIYLVTPGSGTATLDFQLGYSLPGSEAALIPSFDGIGGVAAVQQDPGFTLPVGAIQVALTATSTVDNLDQLTAGQWVVRFSENNWAS